MLFLKHLSPSDKPFSHRRHRIVFILTAITTLLGISTFAFFGCSSVSGRKTSDHYDGKKFYNPTLEKQFSPGLTDVFRMMKEGRAKWPVTGKKQSGNKQFLDIGPEKVGVTFVNHATFLIQLPGINILTDPVWSDRASPFSWFGPKRVVEPGIMLENLPKIDIVIISHNHYDHLDIKTLKELNKRFSPMVFVPKGDKDLVESTGIKQVRELDWWDSFQVHPDLQITFTPTQHSSARGLFDRDRSLWGSYFIKSQKQSVYFGGDAGYSTHYTEIKRRLGAPKIALLGIGAYAPSWFMKPMHMNPEEAVIAHKELGAKISIGMHFGTFQLSSERFEQPQQDLKQALKAEQVSENAFITLPEGESRIY